MTDNDRPSLPDDLNDTAKHSRPADRGASSDALGAASPEGSSAAESRGEPEAPMSETPTPQTPTTQTPTPETPQPAQSNRPRYVEDAPTGEVVTGPVRQVPEPATHAYSQAGAKPSTKQMDMPDSSEFNPIPEAAPAGPPTGSGPVLTAPVKKSKRNRGRTIGLIVAAVVLLVVIAGVGSELYVRNKVTDCLQTSFNNLTGTDTDVSVSRRPMIFAMMGGDVPWVQVDTTSGGDTTMRLHARAEGISTDGGTVQSLNGNGYLPYQRIEDLSKGDGEQQSSTPIESITADPSAGTMKIATTVTFAIFPVPATVTLKPVLKDGAVTFEVEDATAMMFGVSKDFAQPIVDEVTTAMFGPLFKQIKVTKLDIAKNGIDFAFDGSDVNLKSAAENTGQSSNTGSSCSV